MITCATSSKTMRPFSPSTFASSLRKKFPRAKQQLEKKKKKKSTQKKKKKKPYWEQTEKV